MHQNQNPEERYEEIDEELRPFSVLLEGMADLSSSQAIRIDQMHIDVPFEIDVICDENGVVTLGSSPPTQPIETTFMPTIHRMRLTITEAKNLYDE